MPKVGLLWRAEWDRPEVDPRIIESCKLREVFRAFQALGVSAEAVIYSDDRVDVVKDQLLGLDGVLVWVNPIEQGRDRSKLDAFAPRGRECRRVGERTSRCDPEDGHEAGARGHQAGELGNRHEAPQDCRGVARRISLPGLRNRDPCV